MSLETLLKDVVEATEASSNLAKAKQALLATVKASTGNHSYRYGDYNVNIRPGFAGKQDVEVVRVTPSAEPKAAEPKPKASEPPKPDGVRQFMGFDFAKSTLDLLDLYGPLGPLFTSCSAATDSGGAGYPKTRVTPNVDPKQTDTFVPQKGDYFRVEYKSGDRSYRDWIFRCEAVDNGAVLGEPVHGHWQGAKNFTFLIKEVNFFDAYAIAEAAGVVAPVSLTDPRHAQRETLRRMLDDLQGGFSWYASPEGRDHWVGIANHLRKKLGLSPLKG